MFFPPEKENAWDVLRNILRLDKKNVYALGAVAHLKEVMQNRGDTKLSGGDLQGARNDFRMVLQYFPDDNYSSSRLTMIEARLAESARADAQKLQRQQDEQQQSRERLNNLRISALTAYRAGARAKALAEWQEYLKLEPNSDEAYFYLGATYLEEKQLDTAILNFEKCAARIPAMRTPISISASSTTGTGAIWRRLWSTWRRPRRWGGGKSTPPSGFRG